MAIDSRTRYQRFSAKSKCRKIGIAKQIGKSVRLGNDTKILKIYINRVIEEFMGIDGLI